MDPPGSEPTPRRAFATTGLLGADPPAFSPYPSTSDDGLGWLFSVPTTSLTVGGTDANAQALQTSTFDVLAHAVVFTPIRS